MASVFAVQRDLEDYLDRLGVEDRDQYAVRLANLYDGHRRSLDASAFLARMAAIRTVVFKTHRELDRQEFERRLLERLDSRYLKKKSPDFPGGVALEHQILQQRERRRSIRDLLSLFQRAVEGRAVESFWESRTQGRLKPQPETIGSSLLAVFTKGALRDRGLVLKEFASGIGYVDIGIVLSGSTIHLIELKVVRGSEIVGVEQLGRYMRTEDRREGWLVVFDARKAGREPGPGEQLEPIRVEEGIVRVLRIDINPIPPSRSGRLLTGG